MNEGSSVLPVNVSVERVRPTVISVQWDILWPCSLTTSNNKDIKFRVQYTSPSNGLLESVDQFVGEKYSARVEVLLPGLTPYTKYSIQVAVLDEQGAVEAFTDPITVETRENG